MMQITARKVALADRHLVLLERIHPAVGVDCLAEQIRKDRFTLYEVHADGLLLGIFIARIDRLLDATLELVILHAAAVVDPPVAMTSILNPIFDQVAKDHGIRSVRVHSDKKGLDRILENNGYLFQEAVYRKAF